MFLIMKDKDFASYTNDITPYTKGDTLYGVIELF